MLITILFFSKVQVLASDTKAKIDFTRQEIDFIQKNPVIRMGIDPDFVPFEFIDNDGSYKGIASDYVELVSKRTGLVFEVSEGLSWNEAYSLAVDKQIDILPCVSKNSDRELHFIFSDPYYQFQRVIYFSEKNKDIKNLADLDGQRVAVQENSSHHGFIKLYNSIEPVLYKTVEEALAAVATGEEVAYVGNLATSNYIIREQGITNLSYISLASTGDQSLYFAVRDDWSVLADIINKALADITIEERVRIHQRWVGVAEERDLTWLWRSIIASVAALLLVLVVSIFWISRLKREIAMRVDAQEQLKKAVEEAVSLRLEAEQSKIEAEKANQTKSSFLARMSHEIRTPLHAINGMAHLLFRTPLNITQQQYLDKILQAGRNMLSIINDILDFSKIESGKLVMENISFDLDNVLEHVINIVHHKADEKNLDFDVLRHDETPRFLIGDPIRVEQILINLLGNAVKFTEYGFVRLEISCNNKKLTSEQNLVIDCMCEMVFTVSDSGIGMAKEHLDNLFQPFSQEDASINRRFGGTGLGLSIVKSFVDMMKGKITVKSELGRGSVFEITLPMNCDCGRKQDIEEHSVMAVLSGKRALVLAKADNKSNHIDDYLKTLGILTEKVTTENDAFALMDKIKDGDHSNCDILVFDHDACIHGGISFWQEVRKTRPWMLQAVSIIVVPISRESLMEELENEDIDAGITKPIIRSVLYNALVGVFRKNIINTDMNLSENSGEISQLSDQKSIRRNADHQFDISATKSKDAGMFAESVTNTKILLIEDNEVNQIIAKSILEQEGYKIILAENGKIGYELFQKHKSEIGLILMDLHMPVMNGFESAELINAEMPSMPIVAMSADAIEGIKARCEKAGMKYYISKPFEPDQIITRIKEILLENKNKQIIIDESDNHSKVNKNYNTEIINIDEGLKRLGGNKELYKAVLEAFVSENKIIYVEIKDALDKKDYAKAANIFHKIKGSAGNVSANEMHKAAASLQKKLEELAENAIRDVELNTQQASQQTMIQDSENRETEVLNEAADFYNIIERFMNNLDTLDF